MLDISHTNAHCCNTCIYSPKHNNKVFVLRGLFSKNPQTLSDYSIIVTLQDSVRFISHNQWCWYHMTNHMINFPVTKINYCFICRCLHSSLLVTQDWCITCCYTSVLIALPHLPLETVMICQSKLLVAEEVKFLGHGPWAEMYVCMYIIHLSVYLMFVLTRLVVKN